MYEYAASLLKIVDGDTVDVRVDLGFTIHYDIRLRLAGINAPEMNNPDGSGVAARAYITTLLNGPLIIQTAKDRKEKYGRYLATIYVGGSTVSVNQQMLDSGHAVPYDGGSPVSG